ncbi:MAG: TIGR03960 family B12-binding radical SAM protein [Polyangiaceae bacterium]|nr:TIGR03960 family B12-binding radical SAM protein [Polyangiaceae bacterium]
MTDPYNHPYAEFLPLVSRPTRYTGAEYGVCRKDWNDVDVRVCLAFPDLYDIGMSHLGLRILYAILNGSPRILAERCYAPWVDLERQLRDHRQPLLSLESARPLRAFDVVGFSLQYELTYTNVLTMLELGGIPLRTDQRRDDDPLVLVGGPVATHAEPLAMFFDAALIGDGEEGAAEIALEWMAGKRSGLPRAGRLRHLARIPGVYVPSLYGTDTDAATGLSAVVASTCPEARLPVERRIVDDLDRFPFPATGPVGGPESVFDRVSIEIARGCTEGCRFCQAGMIYRPLRERDPEQVVGTALNALALSGQDELGLSALSTADVSCIATLVKRLGSHTAAERVSLGIASLRAYGVGEDLLDEMRKVRASGLTFAPEAGTQRLRDLINKNVTEAQLLQTAEHVFSRGFEKIKLYFMIGLPTEQDGDVLGIAEVARNTIAVGRRHTRRAKVTVSVSNHVPKPHTPFQWCAMNAVPEIERKQRLLRDALRGARGIETRFHHANTSWLEAALARGDRRLGPVLERAFSRGARFDSWEDQLRLDLWQEALAHYGIDVDGLLRELPPGARLPWDHVHVGLAGGFLEREYRRALRLRVTPPCGKPPDMVVHHASAAAARADNRRLICYDCGVSCDLTRMRERRIGFLEKMEAGADGPTLPTASPQPPALEQVETPSGEATQGIETAARSQWSPERYRPKRRGGAAARWRLRYSKLGPSALLGHLDLARELPRVVRRAGVRTGYTQGFRPKPDMSFGPALALGIRSLDEYLDIVLIDAPQPEVLLDSLNRVAVAGLAFTGAVRLGPGDAGLGRILTSARYVVGLPEPTVEQLGGDLELARRVAEFLAKAAYRIVREGNRAGSEIDIRAACLVLQIAQSPQRRLLADAGLLEAKVPLEMQLRLPPGASARPAELVEAIVGQRTLPQDAVRVALLAGDHSPLDLELVRHSRKYGTAETD